MLAQFNREREAAAAEQIHIGIGINTGEVVAGYLGSSKALEYTVIGDTVNTGARLCSIGQGRRDHHQREHLPAVREHFDVIELPATQVKGKSQPLKVFNVSA